MVESTRCWYCLPNKYIYIYIYIFNSNNNDDDDDNNNDNNNNGSPKKGDPCFVETQTWFPFASLARRVVGWKGSRPSAPGREEDSRVHLGLGPSVVPDLSPLLWGDSVPLLK